MMDHDSIANAAQLVIQSRNAIRSRQRSAATAAAQVVTIRSAAAQFNVSKSQVARAIKHLETGRVARLPGRPRLINYDEDSALVAYVNCLQRGGFLATRAQVEVACNTLRQRRDPSALPVSRMWYHRWLADHPELRATCIKALKTFVPSDTSIHIEHFHKQLDGMVTDCRIGPSECWNADECGLRVGRLRERLHIITTRTTRHLRPDGREFCTLLGAGNAAGDSAPPWLIFKVFPAETWVKEFGGVRFSKCETGTGNGEMVLDWIRHFNAFSWKKSSRAQQSGKSLVEWFGCDEWCKEPGLPLATKEPEKRPEGERICRLLIIDGFPGHTAVDFIQYCIKFDIVLAIFPPFLTHILQPLEVGIFRPLKYAQQKIIRQTPQYDNIEFSQLDFLSSFQQTYEQGFTTQNIISGFQKTGMFPITGDADIRRTLDRQPEAANPALASPLPNEPRCQPLTDTVGEVSRTVTDTWSTESNLLEGRTDQTRLVENSAKRMRRRRTTQPVENSFYNGITPDEVQGSTKQVIAAEIEKAQQRQYRKSCSILLKEMDRIMQDYRKSKVQDIDGKRKTLTIKQWLEHTQRTQEFFALETSRKVYSKLLNEQQDCPRPDSLP